MKTRNPTLYTDLMKASTQEHVWAETAKAEAFQDKGNVFSHAYFSEEDERIAREDYEYALALAKELKWDSDIADAFHHMRKERSQNYRNLAKKTKGSD